MTFRKTIPSSLLFLLFSLAPKPSLAIINGIQELDEARFPFTGRVVTVEAGLTEKCTGFLLTPKTVITAAHCMPPNIGMQNGGNSSIYVYNRLGSTEAKARNILLKRYMWEFSANGDGKLVLPGSGDEREDIAILFLDNPFLKEALIQKVKLGFSRAPETLHPAFVFGIGQFGDASKDVDGRLRAYEYKSQPGYGTESLQDRIEFGDIDQGAACHGDSGAPLLFQSPETREWHLAGVFSSMDLSFFGRLFGGDCTAASSNSYTAVHWHLEWIQRSVRDLYKRNGEEPPREIMADGVPTI